jgi:hypothetical protein
MGVFAELLKADQDLGFMRIRDHQKDTATAVFRKASDEEHIAVRPTALRPSPGIGE